VHALTQWAAASRALTGFSERDDAIPLFLEIDILLSQLVQLRFRLLPVPNPLGASRLKLAVHYFQLAAFAFQRNSSV
jgi:hypothetical protein